MHRSDVVTEEARFFLWCLALVAAVVAALAWHFPQVRDELKVSFTPQPTSYVELSVDQAAADAACWPDGGRISVQAVVTARGRSVSTPVEFAVLPGGDRASARTRSQRLTLGAGETTRVSARMQVPEGAYQVRVWLPKLTQSVDLRCGR